MYEYAYKQTLTFLTTHVSLLSSKKMFMYENLQIFKNAYYILFAHFGFLDYGSMRIHACRSKSEKLTNILFCIQYIQFYMFIQTGHFYVDTFMIALHRLEFFWGVIGTHTRA